MTENTSDHGEIFLSAKLIQEWQAEYTDLMTQRAELARQATALNTRQNEVANKISLLTGKLRGATQFLPSVGEWLSEQEFDAQPDNTTLTKAILRTILRFPGNPMVSRGNIQANLPNNGYPLQKLQASPNYVYVALKRLADRKLITEPQPAHYQLTEDGRMEAQKP